MNIRHLINIKGLLFENQTIKQTIFKNTFWVALATGLSKFLKLILIIYVARILGATEYGKFTFALAFISLFIIFHNFGLSSIVTREFSREKEKEKEFSSILSLKILLGLGAAILVLIGSFFVTSDPDVRKTIWILAIFSLIGNFSVMLYAFLRACQKMEYEAFAVILEAFTVTVAGFFIILNFPSIINLSYGYLFSVLVSLIFAVIIFHFRLFPLRISWQKTIWQKFLKMSWPLALTSLFATIYGYIDSVMMGYMGQMTETGWYNAAYRIVLFTTVPMGIMATSFYPVLSKFFKESKEKLQNLWDYYLEMMILAAVPLVIGGMTLAPKVVNFIYGQDFSSSILAFQILIIMAGIFFLSKPLTQLLIVSNQQKKVLWTALLGALINVILNLILIPKFSLYGAAVATVITYLLILLMLLGLTSKFTMTKPVNLKLFFNLVMAIFSSMVMYFVISRPLIYNLHVFISTLIGMAIYLIILFILKTTLKKMP